MRAKTSLPESRIGICCGDGCGELAQLYKLAGIYRYRCSYCYQLEVGRQHPLDDSPRLGGGAPVAIWMVRALRRAWTPIQEAQAQAALCDAGFDGGEFSAAAHDRLLDDLRSDMVSRLARAWHVAPPDLEEAAHALEQFEALRWVSAAQERNRRCAV